jgi:hypothetical protein
MLAEEFVWFVLVELLQPYADEFVIKSGIDTNIAIAVNQNDLFMLGTNDMKYKSWYMGFV